MLDWRQNATARDFGPCIKAERDCRYDWADSMPKLRFPVISCPSNGMWPSQFSESHWKTLQSKMKSSEQWPIQPWFWCLMRGTHLVVGTSYGWLESLSTSHRCTTPQDFVATVQVCQKISWHAVFFQTWMVSFKPRKSSSSADLCGKFFLSKSPCPSRPAGYGRVVPQVIDATCNQIIGWSNHRNLCTIRNIHQKLWIVWWAVRSEEAWACHVWWQPSTHQHPTHQPRFWGLICSPENVGRLAAQMFAHSSQDWRAWWVLWPLTDIIWQTDLSDPSLRRVGFLSLGVSNILCHPMSCDHSIH